MKRNCVRVGILAILFLLFNLLACSADTRNLSGRSPQSEENMTSSSQLSQVSIPSSGKASSEVLSPEILDSFLDDGNLSEEEVELIYQYEFVPEIFRTLRVPIGYGLVKNDAGDPVDSEGGFQYLSGNLTYRDYHFLFLIKDSGRRKQTIDIEVIPKESSEHKISTGPIYIDSEYYIWSGYAVLNAAFEGGSNDNIQKIYYVNLETKRFECLVFHTAEIFNEGF